MWIFSYFYVTLLICFIILIASYMRYNWFYSFKFLPPLDLTFKQSQGRQKSFTIKLLDNCLSHMSNISPESPLIQIYLSQTQVIHQKENVCICVLSLVVCCSINKACRVNKLISTLLNACDSCEVLQVYIK